MGSLCGAENFKIIEFVEQTNFYYFYAFVLFLILVLNWQNTLATAMGEVFYKLTTAVAALQLCTTVTTQEFEPKDYCLYGESCWPSSDVFEQLENDQPTLKVILRGG